ncbi:acyl-CoA dehydrogenase family protein [Streptomyces sp. NPDC059851]|uniref:acyl-CoA dehydrogenase family protein n=1 Tax=Streptomyces sp. NPDC059851 TaxID=3346971 RepID=UPI003647D5FA
MRFLLTEEQSDFARALRGLLAGAEVPAAVRAWAAGDPGPGRALWGRLARAGLFAPAVPEAYGGAGLLPVELAVALVEVGRAGVPGPVVETAAAAVLLSRLGDEAVAKRFLPGLAAGGEAVTLVLPGGSPYALDADTTAYCFTVSESGELRVVPAGTGGGARPLRSTDPARRLSLPPAGGELLAVGPHVTAAAGEAARWARLLTAAQCLGLGEELLARTVGYARQRTQFGMPIGGFQAVKHRLADTLLALEFARPLLWAAALSPAPGEVAAAKLAAGGAAYGAALTALQVHGAVGYTEELDLSLWLRKARPLRDAWGSPRDCRAAVVAEAPGQAGRFSCQETPKRSLTQPKRALKP